MSQQINLFNPIFLKQKKYFSAATMLQALALIVGGMLLLDVFAVRQTVGLQRLLGEVMGEAGRQRDQLVGLGKQYSSQGKSKDLEQEIVRAEAQLRSRQQLLGDIKTGVGGNAEGFSRYLSALARRSVPGVWLTGIDIGGKADELTIRGRTLDADLIPAYVRALSAEPAFGGRALSALKVEAKQGTYPAESPAAEPRRLRYLEFTLSFPLGSGEGGAAQRGAS